MIPWQTIKPALFAWVKYGTGLDQVVGEDEERPYTERIWCSIGLNKVEMVGANDYVRYDSSGNAYVLGVRRIYLTVAVESINQGWDAWAAGPMERMKTFASLPIQDATLEAGALAWVNLDDTIPVPDYEVDTRVISRVQCTVWFDYAVNAAVDDPATKVSWIQVVGLTGHLKNEAGVELPNPALNKTNEQVSVP